MHDVPTRAGESSPGAASTGATSPGVTSPGAVAGEKEPLSAGLKQRHLTMLGLGGVIARAYSWGPVPASRWPGRASCCRI